MKKTLTIFICFLIMILPFSFPVFAEVVNITTPLHEPQPVYEVLSDRIHITFYWVQNVSNQDLLFEIEASYPLGTNMYFMKSGVGMFRTDQQPIEITQNSYVLSDGSLKASGNDPMSNYQSTVDGITYKYFKWCAMQLGSFFYPDNPAIKIDLPLYEQKYSITWAPDLPYVHTYKSYTSEPVCDDLNRYFILAGENNSYLYVIHYFLSEAVTFENNVVVAAPGSVETSYQFSVKNLFCPYIDLTNSGFELSINCDSDMLQLINANGSHIITYDLQVAQYNLLDGQYVASYVFTDLVLTQNKIPLNVNLGNPEDYDSAKFYGVFYQDTSTTYHLNFLACTFSIDPDFEVWKDQVNQYLELIYQALTESEEEPATIADDMSAYDEMQSAKDALQVTDENGSEIDAAEQVEIAFSEAASGMADLSDGVQSVNGLISDLLLVHPYVIIPLIVALALGLVVTILGKNKSD